MAWRLPAGLPPLEGRGGVVVRAAYAALLALTLAMLAYGGWLAGRDFFVVVPNNLEFGFVTGSGSPNFPDVDQVRIYNATSEAARRSGLRQDDIILSINGRPVPADATEHLVGDMIGETSGDTAILVTRSSDGTVRTHRLPRQQGVWDMPIANTGLTGWQRSLLLFGADQLRLLFLAAAAILLYRRRPRDSVALLFGAVCLLMCHRSNNGFWFWHMLGSEQVRNYLSLAQYVGLVIALNAFPDGRFWPPWARWLTLAALPAIAAIFLLTVVAGVLPAPTLTWTIVALLLASAVGLIQRYRALPPGATRQQIKWAVAGFVAFIVLTCIPLLPRIFGATFRLDSDPITFTGTLLINTAATIALPLGLLISLLRYRLYDADVAISRSATYSVLTMVLVGLFAASKQVIEIFGERYFEGDAAALSGGAAAALVAILITPLHHWLARWTEERFQKPLVSLRRGLPELVGDLRETASLDVLARAVLERVEAGVPASRAALIVDGRPLATRGAGEDEVAAWVATWTPIEPTRFDCDRRDPLFPMRIPLHQEGVGDVGWLLLGPRPDGSLYGRDERAALLEVKGPVARAIQIVREREASAERDGQTARKLGRQVAALAKRLTALERRVADMTGGRRPGIAAE